MFSSTSTQAQITALIKSFNMAATLTKASGVTVKTYAVQGKADANNATQSVGLVTQSMAIVYIPGGLKNIPEVGDVLTFNKIDYTILAIETYEPTNVVLAYKLSLT